ncbi:MAG TPA: non-homologous end-joining DNA ligase [Gammaproteobacteria bacterium]|nr:non-homologous end-joining DNA ligase [Gammaproteobacteria bacterium]
MEETELIEVAGRTVAISHPRKVLFPRAGHTKVDVARYYLAVADGALRGAGGRPNMLVRYPNGIGAEFFYQKRAPRSRPDWVEVVELTFPSGRTADEVVPRDAAALIWLANLGCLELHPHPVRAENLDHPDELRVDLDPVRGVSWPQVRTVARVVHEVLDELGLVGWPKTSGKRGLHVYVRIEPRWNFDEVRRAALALAREVERRAPDLATSKWWKEERRGVFIDYNQNAKDRTVAAAYSVRPTEHATVSAPLAWDEVATAEPEDFTLVSMPGRFAKFGYPHARIDANVSSLDRLLALHESQGLGDAPWPPHYRKQQGEPPRVRPSKARTAGKRRPRRPLIEIGRAKREEDALAGLERWKKRHRSAAAHLEDSDVLVDAMRGRYSTWTRIRLNLEHVPKKLRPSQEALDPDDSTSLSS